MMQTIERTPVCHRCGTPASRVYQPTLSRHPNGFVQTKQDAYCPSCRLPFYVASGDGVRHATLPFSGIDPAALRCTCGNPKAVSARRCSPCAIAARTFLPQDTSKGQYRGRHRNAPGLTTHAIDNLLTRWTTQSRTCTYCDAPATTVDHVIPLARGGDNYEGNLVPACRPCNSSKGARLIVEWKAHREAARTQAEQRGAATKPATKQKPSPKPAQTCTQCGRTRRRTSAYCSKCDPETREKQRITMRNRYRTKVGLTPSDEPYVYPKPVFLGAMPDPGDPGVLVSPPPAALEGVIDDDHGDSATAYREDRARGASSAEGVESDRVRPRFGGFGRSDGGLGGYRAEGGPDSGLLDAVEGSGAAPGGGATW